MTDAFVLLGLPRRPLLEEDALTSAYLALAKSLHPDSPAGDTDKFSETKAAFELLRDPAQRLRHLIELETGQKPKPQAPTVAGCLFSDVCAATEFSRSILTKVATAKSPLVRALQIGELRSAVSRTESVLQAVAKIQSQHSEELAHLDSEWPKYPEAATLAANLGFLAKCRHQLEESLFELTQVMRSQGERASSALEA